MQDIIKRIREGGEHGFKYPLPETERRMSAYRRIDELPRGRKRKVLLEDLSQFRRPTGLRLKNTEHTASMALRMKHGGKFRPIQVQVVPGIKDVQVIDGAHRLEAARMIGARRVPIVIAPTEMMVHRQYTGPHHLHEQRQVRRALDIQSKPKRVYSHEELKSLAAKAPEKGSREHKINEWLARHMVDYDLEPLDYRAMRRVARTQGRAVPTDTIADRVEKAAEKVEKKRQFQEKDWKRNKGRFGSYVGGDDEEKKEEEKPKVKPGGTKDFAPKKETTVQEGIAASAKDFRPKGAEKEKEPLRDRMLDQWNSLDGQEKFAITTGALLAGAVVGTAAFTMGGDVIGIGKWKDLKPHAAADASIVGAGMDLGDIDTITSRATKLRGTVQRTAERAGFAKPKISAFEAGVVDHAKLQQFTESIWSSADGSRGQFKAVLDDIDIDHPRTPAAVVDRVGELRAKDWSAASMDDIDRSLVELNDLVRQPGRIDTQALLTGTGPPGSAVQVTQFRSQTGPGNALQQQVALRSMASGASERMLLRRISTADDSVLNSLSFQEVFRLTDEEDAMDAIAKRLRDSGHSSFKTYDGTDAGFLLKHSFHGVPHQNPYVQNLHNAVKSELTEVPSLAAAPTTHFTGTPVGFTNVAARVWDKETLDINADPEAMKIVSRAVYDESQARFAQMGVKSFVLSRGMTVPIGNLRGSGVKVFGSGAKDTWHGINAPLQPINSFTSNPKAAVQYAASITPSGTEAGRNVVMRADVPVERIWSHSRFGIGHYGADEFALIGGPLLSEMTSVHGLGDRAPAQPIWDRTRGARIRKLFIEYEEVS